MPERVNFKALIAELIAAGVSIYKISMITRRQYNQVMRWQQGSEPKHFEGETLKALHAEHVSRKTLQM